MRGGMKRILVWAPTGMGKTTVAAALAEAVQKKAEALNKPASTWMLAHRHEIAEQAFQRFSDQELRVGMTMGEVEVDPTAPTQVVSLQTLAARTGGASKRSIAHLQPPKLLIVDEAHHLVSETWRRSVDSVAGDAVVVYLSATPWGKDGVGLGIADCLVKGPTPEQLVEMGVLVPPEIYCGPAPDTTKITVRAGDFANDVLAAASNELAGDLVKTWQDVAPGTRTLCFAVNLAHSMTLVERFRAAGVAAEHVDWSTPKKLRREIFDKLAAGDVKVVSNVEIVTEGFDCPAVDTCILGRATRSDRLYLQMIGRALRASAGKTKAIVLDHGNNAFRHGHPFTARPIHLVGGEDKKRTPKEKDVSDQATFVSCGKCLMANPKKAMVCEHCGEKIIRKSPPKEKKAVKLVRFTDLSEEQRAAFSVAERRVAWYRFVAMGVSRSWSPWRVSYAYRAQFGIMPHEDAIFTSERERATYWMERKRKSA